MIQCLNQYRHCYYNLNAHVITDREYDDLFDELETLEKETGIIYANSPTQTVGYTPVSSLKKAELKTALLSLDKTKQVHKLFYFMDNRIVLLMLKLDGLTVELDYDDGRLVKACTRGNGIIGEEITHNVPPFENVPMEIPYKQKLRLAGEALIYKDDFNQMK